MASPKKSSGKSAPAKGPPAGSQDNLHKKIESEQIAAHIDAFEKSGGRVEKLGVTRTLQNIGPLATGPVAPPPKPRKR
ncbi:MAG: hypothetical protein WKF61_03225 [Luteimonas sp.]